MREFNLGAVTAYAIAVKHGFKGTEAEWVAYMQSNAAQAKEAEANAKQYAENAKTSETNASQSAQAAQTAEQNASVSEQNAAKSAQDAKESAIKAGGVQTINGKTPDENGNVEIDSVASWNDLTDKPFGEVSGIVEILPECQPENTDDWGQVLYGAVDVNIGDTCTVNWNGVEYTCVVQEFNFLEMIIPALGDIYTGTEGEQGTSATGEPFVLMFIPGVSSEDIGCLVGALDGSTSNTLSISKEQTITKPLPIKYLPDGVPYVIGDGMVAVLPECQPTYDEGDVMFVVPSVIQIEEGKTYTVNWNGVEYICVAQDGSAMGVGAILGDIGAMDGEPTTGEPFIIVPVSDEGLTRIAVIDGTTELTLAIYSKGAEIRKLDNRCLDLAWLPKINEVDLLPETTVSATDKDTSNGTYFAFLNSTAIPVETGQKVAVYFDGVRYEAEVVWEYETNHVYLNSTKTLGITFRKGSTSIFAPASGEYAVRVCGFEPNKLPAAFLPDDATVFYLTSPNGTKFAITVADDGTLSATEVTA